MDEKALDALRNGLEDSYWYGDDDEKVFNDLVRKAEAFDKVIGIMEDRGGPVYSTVNVKRVIDKYKSLEV